MMRALAAEFAKLRRARMLLWTVLVVVGYTAIGLAVFPIIEDSVGVSAPGNPVAEAFASAGLVEINWQNAMRFIPMGVSGAWGVLLLSLIAAYVFGREAREGTDVTAATLPVRREWFVAAKLAVIAVWSIGLAALSVVAQVGVDLIYLGTDGFAMSYVGKAFVDTLLAMLPVYLTLPLVARLSLSRKGYLRPMLFALVMFMIASSMVGMDAAAYFPWSMPIALVGVTWMPLASGLTATSWVIAAAVFVVGLVILMRKVNRIEAAL